MISPVLPSYARAKLSFVKGEGSWLVEADGRRFLDFGSGIAVMALGHGHPAGQALKDQADKLWHTSNLYTVPEQEALAERLVEHTFADTVFFCNSGTEAAELAIKMARKYRYESDAPERTTILTFEGAFHGRSMAAISAAGSEKLTKGFGPLLPGFRQLPFGDHDALRAAAAEPDVGAIMVEPVQGEGGIRPLPDLPQGPARSLRRTRASPDPRRDPVRHGAHGRSSPMNGPGSRPISCWSPRASAAATPSARFWPPRRPRAA
jgi:acetylornithine/N-succinyldiaminopimelate aminotransferase